MMKITKKAYLQTFGLIVIFLAFVRCLFPSIAEPLEGSNMKTPDVRNEQGTEIHVVLPSDMTFSYGFSGNTAEFISEQFDPFSGEKQMLYYKIIWDVLCGTIENT